MAIVINGTGTITGISATDGLSSPQTGSVLQVVTGTTATQTSTTSTTPVATGLTASITPKFATSKIFVVASVPTYVNGAANTTAYYGMYRNSTNIMSPQGTRQETSGTSLMASGALSVLDSPTTTSSTSYTVYYWVQSGVTAYMCVGSSFATITLLEIAA